MTRELRALNDAFDGPAPVTLAWCDDSECFVQPPDDRPHYDYYSEHVEHIPGDGKKFDAVAVARRLIANIPR